MKRLISTAGSIAILASLIFPGIRPEVAAQEVKEQSLQALHGMTIKVRMEGPYTADTPLQVVCYFKYSPEGAKRMSGAPVELDKHFGGLIGSLRTRGEFVGDEFETMLIDAPAGTIKAKRLLLIGLGDEASLSLDRLERVGRTAAREAAKLGATRVAFAPLIRDQGNSRIATGEVERAITRGVLLAYDTEKRLQEQGFAAPFTLEEWAIEAGPKYFDETVAGAKKAVGEAKDAAARRDPKPYSDRGR